MDKEKKQRAIQIYAEIRDISDTVKCLKKFNRRHEEIYECFHAKLNNLIKELKYLKIGLLVKDVEYIRNLKTELWCGCSVEYQQDFMTNCKARTY